MCASHLSPRRPAAALALHDYSAVYTPTDGKTGLDVLYHSAASYTSLGDSQAFTAEWRLMTAVEALTGLVLITWTALFTFLVMQKIWAPHESAAPPDSPVGTPRT